MSSNKEEVVEEKIGYVVKLAEAKTAGEKGTMFKLVKSRFSEVHCETLYQKV